MDIKRFEDEPPCYLCGYNGPGYFNSDVHPCASEYHQQRDNEADRMPSRIRELEQELAEARRTIDKQELSVLAKEAIAEMATEKLKEVKQDRDRLKDEVESLSNITLADRMCHADVDNILAWEDYHKYIPGGCVHHKAIAETINQTLKEWRELKAEVERLRLRWQTGPIPEDGDYLCDQHMYGSKFNFFRKNDTNASLCLKRWAGPIQPLEEGK